MLFYTYAELSAGQCAVLKKHVAGEVVYDLGAGGLEVACTAIELGAARVIAVDKLYKERAAYQACKYYIQTEGKASRLLLRAKTFEEFARGIGKVGELPVALVSWPCNTISVDDTDLFLAVIVALARKVIYIGSNFDGTACGGPALFRELRRRRVLEHVPSRQNSLIVYSHEHDKARVALPEEAAATSSEVVYYSEVFPSEARLG